MKITFSNHTLQVPDIVDIPCIQGDCVGTEITPAMQQVVQAAVLKAYGTMRSINWVDIPAGQRAHDELGTCLPESTLQALRDYRVAIKGPLTTPVGGGIRSLNVAIRQSLDLYVCLRPVRWFKGVASPVKHPERVDITVFRENTEDIYAGIEWAAGSPEARRLYEFLHDEMGVNQVRFPESSAYGIKPVSRHGTQRLVYAACQYAHSTGRQHVTLVHKGNIMKYTEGGFRQWGYEVGHEFEPFVRMDDCIADAFLQNALIKPEAYDVVATLNLNGDYISDMLAAQVGGIGISPGANINYDEGLAVFEATHGTAPDIAGRNVVNPSSMILSAAMLLDHIHWNEAAQLIRQSLERTFVSGMATADLAQFMPDGQSLGTREFTLKLQENILS